MQLTTLERLGKSLRISLPSEALLMRTVGISCEGFTLKLTVCCGERVVPAPLDREYASLVSLEVNLAQKTAQVAVSKPGKYILSTDLHFMATHSDQKQQDIWHLTKRALLFLIPMLDLLVADGALTMRLIEYLEKSHKLHSEQRPSNESDRVWATH